VDNNNQVAIFLAVLAAATPILLALLGGVGWLYKRERERRDEAERMVSEQKQKAYAAILQYYYDLVKTTSAGQRLTAANATPAALRLIDAQKDLIVYGSDTVVDLYPEIARVARALGASTKQATSCRRRTVTSRSTRSWVSRVSRSRSTSRMAEPFGFFVRWASKS
jgi:hypothetical protein